MTWSIYGLIFLMVVNSIRSDGVNPRFYPNFHIAPPKGWMNDPNGLCFYKNFYHLFYQYNPYSSQEPGIAHWGHARNKDWFHWEHLPIAMSPTDKYDSGGVFSGSALVENDTMYLFYTGNVNHEGQTPDHEQHQALAWSTDGVEVTKYEHNPIIKGSDRQPNFRDPKVWKHDDTYYMVLGNSYNNDTLGRVLLYSSKDMYNWKEVSILDSSYGFLGYMWECPDFFELDGYFVLFINPQGMDAKGIDFNNLYQSGYIIGCFDYKSLKFTILTNFRELDHGHDFYATQTMEDKNGDRVMIAWADMWEEVYPERDDGFTGHMIIPRVLTIDHQLRLLQKPVEQINGVVGKRLYSGKTLNNTVVKLENNTAQINVRVSGSQDFELIIESSEKCSVTLSYNYEHGLVTLDRGGKDGKRSAKWRPRGDLRWTVYIDSSSVELFDVQGVITFTSRFFPDGPVCVRIGKACEVGEMTVNSMKHTVPIPAIN